MNKKMTLKRKYPTQEVNPQNFLTNEEVLNLLETKHTYKFKKEDFHKLYNCVHCRECGTSDERILLKQKFLKDGNKIEGLEEVKKIYEKYGTPFKDSKNRIKLPNGIPTKSDTLLYFGCFTSVKNPRYGENVANYLLKQNVEYTVLEKEICCGYPILVTGITDTYNKLVERNKKVFKEMGFKKVITVCPSCYMVFKKHYSDIGIKIDYFTDYLKPASNRKSGDVCIQHACPLVYDCKPGIDKRIENILKKSGYRVIDIPYFCCGGGGGMQLIEDTIEKIAKLRMRDYRGNFTTYYCPDCGWFIKFFGRKLKIKPKPRDICELLL